MAFQNMEAFHKAAIKAMEKYGFERQVQASFIHFSENASYLITDRQSGKKLGVLRICRPGYHTISRLNSELRWLEQINKDVPLTVPRPVQAADGSKIQTIKGIDGKDYRCILFEFIEGRKPDVENEQEAVRQFFHLGKITACLHKQSKGFAGAKKLDRISWTYHNLIGKTPVWGEWQSAPDLTMEQERLLARTSRLIEKRLREYGKNDDNYGLIHADLRMSNLLVEGEQIKVIDFDDCGFGWYLHDMASAFSFIETKKYIPELMDSWLEGYQQIMPLSAGDLKETDTFIMQRRMQLMAWMASHPDSEPVKEFGEGFTEGTVELAERYLKMRFS